jgi:hypothetical protein
MRKTHMESELFNYVRCIKYLARGGMDHEEQPVGESIHSCHPQHTYTVSSIFFSYTVRPPRTPTRHAATANTAPGPAFFPLPPYFLLDHTSWELLRTVLTAWHQSTPIKLAQATCISTWYSSSLHEIFSITYGWFHDKTSCSN